MHNAHVWRESQTNLCWDIQRLLAYIVYKIHVVSKNDMHLYKRRIIFRPYWSLRLMVVVRTQSKLIQSDT